MAWEVKIDFQDGNGYRDLMSWGGEQLVLADSLERTEILHNDKFEPVQDSLKFSALVTETLTDAILDMAADDVALVDVDLDESDFFTGYVRPVTGIKIKNDPGDTVQFECLDNSYRLLASPQSPIEYEDYKVCDPADKPNSIVHQLLDEAGYTLGTDEAITDTISTTITHYRREEGEKSFSDLLTEQLYNYGYTYYFDSAGVFKLYKWLLDSAPSAAATLDDDDLQSLEIKIEDNKPEQYVVSWYDVVQSTHVALWKSYSDERIWYPPSNKWPSETTHHFSYDPGDGNRILKSENHTLWARVMLLVGGYSGGEVTREISAGGSISVQGKGNAVSQFSANGLAGTATVEFQGPDEGGLQYWIRSYRVYGNVYALVKQGEVKNPSTAGNYKTIKVEAENVLSQTEAQELAQALQKHNEYGRYKYRFSSEAARGIGDYIDVSNTKLNRTTTARIIRRKWTSQNRYLLSGTWTPIYDYECIGVAELGTLGGSVETGQYDPPTFPADIAAGIETVSDVVNEEGAITAQVAGNEIPGAPDNAVHRSIVDFQKLGIQQLLNGEWTDVAHLGGDLSDSWPSFLKTRGVAATGADLGDLDIGDELPTGAKVWQFNNDVLDLDDTDYWDTETGANFTTASRFGSHALTPAVGGTTSLEDNDAQGIDMSAAWTISGWFYLAENPDTDTGLFEFYINSETETFWRVVATSTGITLDFFPDTGTAPPMYSEVTGPSIALSMSGWFFVALTFDGTDTWQLVVNDTAATPLTHSSFATATHTFKLTLPDGGRCDDLLILPGTALSTSAIDAHFDSGYPWATEDADGNLYLVPGSGKEVVVKGAFRVGDGEYKTGWVACSTWSNQHLGDTVGGNVAHGLNTHLTGLDVQVFLSTHGTDATSWQVKNISYLGSTANQAHGYQVDEVDSNTITVQTGANGLAYFSGSGAYTILATSSFYYQIVVRIASPAKGADGQDGADGADGADGTSGVSVIATQWDSGTTYAEGDIAAVNATVYKSEQDSNTNHNPSTDDGTWWTVYTKTASEMPLGTILMWHKSLEARGGTARETGTATTDTTDKLIDSSATFVTNNVAAGDIVYNSTDSTYATVQSVDSETQLTLDWDAFPDGNEAYSVYPEPDVQPGWIEMDGSTINDPDSKYHGMTIEDVVGSERFFRARETAGRLQEDAMQRITGQVGVAAGNGFVIGSGDSGALSTESNATAANGAASAGYARIVKFDSAGSTSPNTAKTDDVETRAINLSIVPIVKIKESADVKLATYYSVAGDNFNTLTELTSLHADDVLVIYDDSAGVYKKVKLSTLKTWINT